MVNSSEKISYGIELIEIAENEIDNKETVKICLDKLKSLLNGFSVCSFCKKTVGTDAIFCSSCGKKLDEKPESICEDFILAYLEKGVEIQNTFKDLEGAKSHLTKYYQSGKTRPLHLLKRIIELA